MTNIDRLKLAIRLMKNAEISATPADKARIAARRKEMETRAMLDGILSGGGLGDFGF